MALTPVSSPSQALRQWSVVRVTSHRHTRPTSSLRLSRWKERSGCMVAWLRNGAGLLWDRGRPRPQPDPGSLEAKTVRGSPPLRAFFGTAGALARNLTLEAPIRKPCVVRHRCGRGCPRSQGRRGFGPVTADPNKRRTVLTVLSARDHRNRRNLTHITCL